MAITAVIAGVVVAAGSAVNEHQQAARTERRADRAADQQMAMQSELQRQQANQEKAAESQAADAAKRQRALASGYRQSNGGFSTSPLGLPGGADTAKGSLLGL